MSKYDSIESMLEKEETVLISPVGNSMLPFLKAGRDTVLLKRVTQPLSKYDVVLYRGKDGGLILHRIIRTTEIGFIICGDNSSVWERGITPNEIIAVVDSVIRNGKEYPCHCLNNKIYERIWCGTLLKRIVFKIKRIFFVEK